MTHGPGLNTFDITARARAAYGPDGRLALPKVAHWPICPFETDSLQVRHLDDPVVPEPPRGGEDPNECHSCQAPDDEFLWTDSRWRVSMSDDPMALPNVWLQSRQHLDFEDLTDQLAAEMGVRVAWIQRALNSIGGVCRPPEPLGRRRRPPARTSRGPAQRNGAAARHLSDDLDYALPPLPSDVWNAMAEHVAASLRSK